MVAVEPLGVAPRPAEGDATPRSGNIERSPARSTSETMTPVPSGSTGPVTSTPSLASRSPTSRPAGSAPRLPSQRAFAPSDATTRRRLRLARRPRARCATAYRRPSRSAHPPHDDVEHEIPERDDPHLLRSSHGARRGARRASATRSRPVVRPRRRHRRLRRRPRARGAGAAASGPSRRGSRPSRARRATASCSSGNERRAVAAQLARREHDRSEVDVGVADPERPADEERARRR